MAPDTRKPRRKSSVQTICENSQNSSADRQIDAGSEARAEASMTKLFCSERAFQIADRAVQIHGGEGIVQGRRVEFLFRMLRMYRVVTGTSEIQRNTIARELLGDLR